jgi:hypothetical protein
MQLSYQFNSVDGPFLGEGQGDISNSAIGGTEVSGKAARATTES